jgi:hypothetical protein
MQRIAKRQHDTNVNASIFREPLTPNDSEIFYSDRAGASPVPHCGPFTTDDSSVVIGESRHLSEQIIFESFGVSGTLKIEALTTLRYRKLN